MTKTNCDNIYIYKLGKGRDDIIWYESYVKCVGGDNYPDIIKACVEKDVQSERPYPADVIEHMAPSSNPHHHLEIPTRPGRNAYVIWLGEGFSAGVDFGGGAAPVSTFAPFSGLISDVKMYCYKEKCPIHVIEGDTWDIPDGYTRPRWASFVFDNDTIKADSLLQHFAEHHSLSKPPYAVPLYFNIYVDGHPNWLFGNHPHGHGDKTHHHNRDAKSDFSTTTHDGPHPTNPSNNLMVNLN